MEWKGIKRWEVKIYDGQLEKSVEMRERGKKRGEEGLKRGR